MYVALVKVRAGTVREGDGRRLQWQYRPQGAKPVARCWLQTVDPHVIAIVEADSVAQLMVTTAGWDDVFDITIVPAITAEAGPEMVRKMQG